MFRKIKKFLTIAPAAYEDEFKTYTNSINLIRAKSYAIAILLMEIIVIISSFYIRKGAFFNKPAVYYLGMYSFLLVTMPVLLLLFYRFSKNTEAHQRGISVACMLLAILMLVWCAFISLLDQFSSGQIIVYIGAAVGISVMTYFKPVTMLIIYSSVQTMFLILLPYFHPAKKGLFGNSLNSTLFVVVSWLISYMRYKSLVEDFNNQKKIMEQTEELNRINQELMRMSFTDSLTGVYNRFMFDKKLNENWEECKRRSIPLALVIIDVDFFKLINDNYGHQEGDKYLRRISEILRESVKDTTEMITRYGGDEFAVLIPGMDEDTVSDFSEKIRRNVEQSQIPHKYSRISKYVTVSLGACSLIPSDSITITNLIKYADDALYEAKKSRNCRRTAVCEMAYT